MNEPFRVVTPVSLQTGFAGTHSPAASGSLGCVIWPSVWPVPPASPPSLSASKETDPR